MADPTPTTPPLPTSAAQPPRVDEGKAAAASAPPSGRPEDAVRQTGTAAEKDPMRELLARMDRMRPLITGTDPALARTMQGLSERGMDTDRRAQIGFRHEVAYALQDLEKTPVGRIDIPQALRLEMTRLAESAPGLENERMASLMRATASIDDKRLVREIRILGADMGRRVNQQEPEAQSRIEALENGVRLARRPPEQSAAAQEAAASVGRGAINGAPGASVGSDDSGPASRRPSVLPGADLAQQAVRGPQQIVVGRAVLDTLMAGMRGRDQGNGAPWDPPPTPMANRLSAFERRMTDAHDERSFEAAVKSGRAALDALQGFNNGEGATVMRRIQQAANSEPGGMSAVLSEMRDGGKFAELRRQFNNALETDLGLAGAYDKASAALRTFDKDRSNVQDIIGRRPDATAITQRFEKLDAEIGEAAAKTPSRNDGQSMFDDLSRKAAELVQTAIAAVKSAFSRSPSADATSRPSPSPSMG